MAVEKSSAKKTPIKKAVKKSPIYQVMVLQAVKNLKERKGASRQAMKKYISAEYKIEKILNHHFNVALKKLTEDGMLVAAEKGRRWKIKKVETAPKSEGAKKTTRTKKTATTN